MSTRSAVNQRHRLIEQIPPFLKALLELCGWLSSIRVYHLFLSVLEKHKKFIVWRLHGEKNKCIFSVYKNVSWKRLRKWSINLAPLHFFSVSLQLEESYRICSRNFRPRVFCAPWFLKDDFGFIFAPRISRTIVLFIYQVLIDYRLLNRKWYIQCIHYDYNKLNYW